MFLKQLFNQFFYYEDNDINTEEMLIFLFKS